MHKNTFLSYEIHSNQYLSLIMLHVYVYWLTQNFGIKSLLINHGKIQKILFYTLNPFYHCIDLILLNEIIFRYKNEVSIDTH